MEVTFRRGAKIQPVSSVEKLSKVGAVMVGDRPCNSATKVGTSSTASLLARCLRVKSQALCGGSLYHRVFSAARWSLDAVGLAVFQLIQPWLGEIVLLALDDTLARKRGLKMFGTGMHHDPLASSRSKAITSWGHSWVMLGVIVEFPFRKGHYSCLPVLFRLYLNKKSAAKHRRVYRTRDARDNVRG
jgi:hypothetical protein